MIDLPSHQKKGACPKPEPKAKKEPYRIPRMSKKQREKIKKNQEFFDEYLANHPTGRCFETGELIPFPDGMNVCHLWSAGASRKEEAYRDGKNVVLATHAAHRRYENGKDTAETKIYQLAQEVIPELKFKHNGYNRY